MCVSAHREEVDIGENTSGPWDSVCAARLPIAWVTEAHSNNRNYFQEKTKLKNKTKHHIIGTQSSKTPLSSY